MICGGVVEIERSLTCDSVLKTVFLKYHFVATL